MIRALAFLLLAANLAYLGWATLIDTRPMQPVVAHTEPPSDVPKIILAAERSAVTSRAANLAQTRRSQTATKPQPISDEIASVKKAESATDTPTPQDPVSAGARCISVGPFQDLPSAAQASATLQTKGLDSRQRLEQGQLWVGYWVSIPGFAKREEAEHALTKLKQNGMTDVYISLSNDQTASNVISLGVFKESERAQRMMAEAKNLGFSAQMTDRTRAGSVYWIDVDLPGDGTDLDFAALGAQPGKILRLEQRACP